jgi:hypothetical protein
VVAGGLKAGGLEVGGVVELSFPLTERWAGWWRGAECARQFVGGVRAWSVEFRERMRSDL